VYASLRPPPGSRDDMPTHQPTLAASGLLAAILAVLPANRAQGASSAAPARSGIPLDDGSSVLYSTVEPFIGDLAAIWRRGELRVLVPYSHTEFFVSSGRPGGYVYEMMIHAQDWLNGRRPRGAAKLVMVFVPTAVERLLPDLLAGRGDVSAGLISVTPERSRLVSFTRPLVSSVSEVVLRHKDATAIGSPADLAGRTVHVLPGSSELEHLRELNRGLSAAGRPSVEIAELPPTASREDLIEMVEAGVFSYAVTDGFLAELWARVLPNLRVDEAARIATGGEIAWAVRPENPELLAALDAFVLQRSKEARVTSAVIFQRYFENARALRTAIGREHAAKLRDFASLFQEAGRKYGFDWLLLGAQALQESRFDPRARNPSGAVGLMQVLPSTALAMGYPDSRTPRSNVLAGAAYLDHLRQGFAAEAGVDPADHIYFALASYNAGPRAVREFRARAKLMGLDPARWFGNVEVAAQHVVGDETVLYVANIARYYLAYRLSPTLVAPDSPPSP